jgi:hypothetical protein
VRETISMKKCYKRRRQKREKPQSRRAQCSRDVLVPLESGVHTIEVTWFAGLELVPPHVVLRLSNRHFPIFVPAGKKMGVVGLRKGVAKCVVKRQGCVARRVIQGCVAKCVVQGCILRAPSLDFDPMTERSEEIKAAQISRKSGRS